MKNLKSYLVNSEHMNQIKTQNIIEKWTNFGFIDDTIINKRNVSIAFEMACVYLLDELNRTKKYEEICVFPVIRKIFNKIETDMSIDSIVNNIIDIIIDFSSKYFEVEESFYDEKNKLLSPDPEALFCSSYANNYIIKL